ncbi:MAG: BON domain-containing protein, partial [Rhodothermales bacterium]
LDRPRNRDARQTTRDLALTRRLYTTFESDLELADVQGIQFYVQNGVVTLYGTVRHELDREMLVSLVRDIAGVQGVVAHLQLVESRFRDGTGVEAD